MCLRWMLKLKEKRQLLARVNINLPKPQAIRILKKPMRNNGGKLNAIKETSLVINFFFSKINSKYKFFKHAYQCILSFVFHGDELTGVLWWGCFLTAPFLKRFHFLMKVTLLEVAIVLCHKATILWYRIGNYPFLILLLCFSHITYTALFCYSITLMSKCM